MTLLSNTRAIEHIPTYKFPLIPSSSFSSLAFEVVLRREKAKKENEDKQIRNEQHPLKYFNQINTFRFFSRTAGVFQIMLEKWRLLSELKNVEQNMDEKKLQIGANPLILHIQFYKWCLVIF